MRVTGQRGFALPSFSWLDFYVGKGILADSDFARELPLKYLGPTYLKDGHYRR